MPGQPPLTPPALMHATQVARPFHTKGWVYEEKYDGWRMLAIKEGDSVRLVSRNGRDHARRFTDLVAAVAKLRPKSLVLDGEVAVFDPELVSRFEWLRHINHGNLATPPMFMAFDLFQTGREGLPEGSVEGAAASSRATSERRDCSATGTTAQSEWIRRVGGGVAPRVGRLRGQGSGVAVCGWAYAAMAQGEGVKVPRGTSGIPQTVGYSSRSRSDVSSIGQTLVSAQCKPPAAPTPAGDPLLR